MRTALGCRADEGLRLDGTRPQQRVPVRHPSRTAEGGRDGDDLGARARQGAIEVREAQIIADGETELAPRQVGENGLLARPIVAALTVALAATQIDIEHMNLVVAGCDLSFRR